MPRQPARTPSALERYGYATVSAALATAARLLLERVLGYHHPYATFYVAVLWSAWYGGVGPALLAVGIGALAAVLLVLPPPFLDGQGSGSLVGFEFYFIVSFTGVILLEAQRRAQRNSERNAAIARERLAQLERETAQRRRAEEDARQAEDQLRLTFEHAPVGLCRVGPDGSFLDVNPQFCAISGYPRQELLHRNFREITYPEADPSGIEEYARLWKGEIPFYTQEKRCLRQNGTAIWTSLTVTLVPETEARPAYAIAAIQDITSRKQAEEHLREAHKLESIGVLAGGIAHDFNNLLTGVLGNASLAIDTLPRNNPARTMLESVVTAAERAARLTGQLLAYAGKGAFRTRQLDLSQLVRSSGDLLRHSLPPNVQLRLELHAALPPLRGDASQIQQLIADLVINGAEAIGPDRAGMVTVRTDVLRIGERHLLPKPDVGEFGPGFYVMLRVQDTGPGVDEANIRRIFDPFFTTKFPGRGLGLAAAAGVVRSQKGAIVVSSAPGRGAQFSVLFPVTGLRVAGWTAQPASQQEHSVLPRALD